MRRIHKSLPPKELAIWKNTFNGTGTLPDYRKIDSDLKKIIMKSLLKEQGGICAYTGIKINEENAHIEHVKAQKYCKKGIDDVDYGNLVACYPGRDVKGCPFGAHAKKDWPDNTQAGDFVSPLSDGCDRKFQYTYSGNIKSTFGDSPTEKTIEKLNLDDAELVRMRRQAIINTLAPKIKNIRIELTPEQARKRLENLKLQKNQLESFHFVLQYQLQRRLEKLP